MAFGNRGSDGSSRVLGDIQSLSLSKLPPRVADVFMPREMEEMEAAQNLPGLQISQNNLWVMLHRARMALRECMELNWFGNKP
jgi:RNA polymerase sigma-70 factor, ECF subfamily